MLVLLFLTFFDMAYTAHSNGDIISMIKSVEERVTKEEKSIVRVTNAVSNLDSAVKNIGQGMRNVTTDFKEWKKKINTERRNWDLQATNVCFGARDNKYGSFRLNKEGFISGIKLVHRSGYVTCDINMDARSNWGCNNHGYRGAEWLMIYVTDEIDRIVLPNKRLDTFYNQPGYHPNTKELILTDRSSTQVYGFEGMPLRLWYSEDLMDQSEGDNGGKACADVYVMFD